MNIIGAIYIDTFKELDRVELEEELSALKLPFNIIVSIAKETDLWMSQDCDRCPYSFGDEEELCNAPLDFKCPEGEYSTSAIVTLYGGIEDAEDAAAALLDYLDEHYFILNQSIKIGEAVQW